MVKSAKYISITVLNPFIIISLNDGAVEALFIALFKPKLNRLVPDGTSSSFKWLTLLYVESLNLFNGYIRGIIKAQANDARHTVK